MNETTFYIKGLYGSPASLTGILWQILENIENTVVLVINNIHNAHRGYIASFKNRIALGINNGIIAVYLCPDKFLHNVLGGIVILVPLFKEETQLLIITDFEGIGSTYTIIWLDYYRVMYQIYKSLGIIPFLNQMPSGCSDASLGIIFFHFGFVFDARNILIVEAGSNLKITAEMSIPLQPILIVGFQPVNFAVFVLEKGYSPSYLVIIFQRGNLVVFIQTIL